MSVQPYLYFNGNCKEAVKYYSEIFKSPEPRIMLYGDVPSQEGMQMAEEMKNLVLHAEMDIKGTKVMFSDTAPGADFILGNNITMMVGSADIEDIKSYFEQLKAGGSVIMELQNTFWSKCYGYVVDKFGIAWQLSCEESGSKG